MRTSTQNSVENDEALKRKVRDYWNEHPCGTQFNNLEWGSKEFFDQVEQFRFATQPFMYELAEFKQHNGEKVLEIGCGLGTDLIQFARNGADTTGIDLTPQSIELLKKRFLLEQLHVNAQVADAENLPFENESFDLVYSFGVLHHTPNTQKAIDEAYRVLKPNGKIIVMLYHKNSFHVRFGAPLYSFWQAANRKTKVRQTSVLKEWIRIYDGESNPLGKAYSKKEFEQMFSLFKNRRYSVYDSYRRRFPKVINAINQSFFASHFGFWLVVKAAK